MAFIKLESTSLLLGRTNPKERLGEEAQHRTRKPIFQRHTNVVVVGIVASKGRGKTKAVETKIRGNDLRTTNARDRRNAGPSSDEVGCQVQGRSGCLVSRS